MEEEIEDYLKDHYRLKLEVKLKEFRHYIINLMFPEATAEINFTYDNHFTFDANMGNLTRYINQCILEYFQKVGV